MSFISTVMNSKNSVSMYSALNMIYIYNGASGSSGYSSNHPSDRILCSILIFLAIILRVAFFYELYASLSPIANVFSG